MMYPLILCSILAIGIILERAYTFRKATSIDPEELLDDIKKAYTSGDTTNATRHDGAGQHALRPHLRARPEELRPRARSH